MDATEPYPRSLEVAVRDALADTPVVVIQGARQVGKSTLAQLVAAGSLNVRQVTLDDPAALAVAESDPAFFVEQAGRGLLVIDEAQRAPGLILPLKASVDRDRRPGRFLLTGSADLLQVKGVGDSLAGRAETVELKPLSQGELTRRSDSEDFASWLLSGADTGTGRFQALNPAVVVTGGYPEVVRRTPQRAGRWFDSYVERLADHDARDLHRGGYPDHLRHLLTLLAAGGIQELVKAKTARTLGVAENTIDTYLRLAATMRLVASLPSWGRSQRGRVARRPKICLHDTGLSAALATFTTAHALTIGGREYYGALVEQFVALELAKQQAWSSTPYSLYHFRDLDGLEVDLIIEWADGRLLAIEVKSSTSITEKAWTNLIRFKDRFPDRHITGACLHAGTQTAVIGGWLHILPITALWQH
ncbi:ATP-binding protein [Propioniciclava sinopodophylli]|uniref:ATP-binding protein n=1 Tax=Propioniciclava sinopodophylli TaxID=1837344 RepID=A0A4V2JS56_9ACTN|nr:ATP-binding protein [Propioniciclava sinopodophylli]TBT82478.1 ATP-binding protein [Propioniciclava sinopodophylli]